MPDELKVLNLHEATYECTFGRGCDGICCKKGRPPLYEDEIERLIAHLPKFLPHMRPVAAAKAHRKGVISNRQKRGLPMMRNVGGWCIFFANGCVLHRVGELEGDRFRYKPAACALFPLAKTENDEWYVRQKGYQTEIWDLFCLDAGNSNVPAAESLQEELALAARFDSLAQEQDGPAPNGD